MHTRALMMTEPGGTLANVLLAARSNLLMLHGKGP